MVSHPSMNLINLYVFLKFRKILSNALYTIIVQIVSLNNQFQEPQIFSDGGQGWMLAVIIIALVCVLVIIIIVLKCCCQKGLPKRKYIKKEDELNSSRPDILHPSLSFDQKMTALGSNADQMIVSPTTDIYQQQTLSSVQQYCEQSSNDGSGNRASVNSQVDKKDFDILKYCS